MVCRNLSLAVLLAASAFLLPGCDNASKGDKPILKVGGILSMSGPAAAYGSDAEKGAQLAFAQASSQNLPFRASYVSTDDKSDKTEAIKAAHALIDNNGAQVILGPAISPSALSVGKFADERGIPMVATSATLDDITASPTYDRKFVFRVCFNDSFQGEVLATFVKSRLKKQRVAIIYDSTQPYSIGLAKSFKVAFEKLGGTVPYEENYSVNDTDYSSLIDKVAQFDVEALFIPGWDENVGPMIKQAAGRWNKFTLIGGDGWPTNRLLELAGGNIPQSYALSHFIADDPASEVVAFENAYKSRYGEAPSPFAALGYDAANLILDAAKRSKTLTPADIRAALESTNGLKLVTGPIKFDAHRNPKKDGIIVKISSGGIHFADKVHQAD